MRVNGFVHETGRLITDRIGLGRHFSLLPVIKQWKESHLKTSYFLIPVIQQWKESHLKTSYLLTQSISPPRKHFRRSNKIYISLAFTDPCIVIYSYSKTNKMHLLSQIIYSCKMLYMFRTVFPSIIRSSKLRVQQRYMSYSCC